MKKTIMLNLPALIREQKASFTRESIKTLKEEDSGQLTKPYAILNRQGEDGSDETTAVLIEWEDGSWGLQIGPEQFIIEDVSEKQKQTTTGMGLYARFKDSEIFEAVPSADISMSVKLNPKQMKNLVAVTSYNKEKTKRTVTRMDPEKQKLELERLDDEKRKLTEMTRRTPKAEEKGQTASRMDARWLESTESLGLQDKGEYEDDGNSKDDSFIVSDDHVSFEE